MRSGRSACCARYRRPVAFRSPDRYSLYRGRSTGIFSYPSSGALSPTMPRGAYSFASPGRRSVLPGWVLVLAGLPRGFRSLVQPVMPLLVPGGEVLPAARVGGGLVHVGVPGLLGQPVVVGPVVESQKIGRAHV